MKLKQLEEKVNNFWVADFVAFHRAFANQIFQDYFGLATMLLTYIEGFDVVVTRLSRSGRAAHITRFQNTINQMCFHTIAEAGELMADDEWLKIENAMNAISTKLEGGLT